MSKWLMFLSAVDINILSLSSDVVSLAVLCFRFDVLLSSFLCYTRCVAVYLLYFTVNVCVDKGYGRSFVGAV